MAETSSLTDLLAVALPKGSEFTVHHLSTPPTSCPAIYAAPPHQPPDETFRESHFLSISITSPNDGQQLHVFALEVFIYTTKDLTTLFVSKADSTGYLHLLKIPTGTPSPIKTIATTFLQWLIEQQTRPGKRLVLSLFARAQNQYLFPGSIENSHKHVLDDRGLIKWWCRVSDPLLKPGLKNGLVNDSEGARESKNRAQAYLRVPGYDPHETRTFFPRDSSQESAVSDRWKAADPLVELGSPDLPERCLIPRFPDDPKARFLDTLDEELPDEHNPPSQSLSQETLDRVNNGRWRSIRSLDQFWEAMSYRQECSSGRLVGFLWAVFTPSDLQRAEKPSKSDTAVTESSDVDSVPVKNGSTKNVHEGAEGAPKADDDPTETTTPVLEISKAYHWPQCGRGEVIVPQTEYDEIEEVLTSLDYANQSIAAESTIKWIKCVANKASVETWGRRILGEKAFIPSIQSSATANGTMNVLSAGLVRKKKRPVATLSVEKDQQDQAGDVPTAPNKKQKLDIADKIVPTSVTSELKS